MTLQTLEDVGELAQQLRVDSIRCSTAAGSGHPTSSMSAADVMAALLARHLRYDWQRTWPGICGTTGNRPTTRPTTT